MQMYKFEQVDLCTFACFSELYYNCNLLGRHYNYDEFYIKCIYIYFMLQEKTHFYDLKMYM